MPEVYACHKEPKPEKKKGRKRIKPFSDEKAASFDLHDWIRGAVFARDGKGCWLHGESDMDCWGGPTVHHRRKAGDNGGYTMENLVTLCAGHNTDIEDRPDYYRDNWPWLVVRAGDAEYDALKERRR